MSRESGAVIAMQGRRREAVGCLHRRFRHGSYPEVYNTLGNVLKDEGELPQAIGAFARRLRCGVDTPMPISTWGLRFR